MPARSRHPRAARAPGLARSLTEPPERIIELVADVVGRAPTRWRPVAGGHTHAGAWLVDAGERLFVKTATEATSLRWFANELHVFGSLRASFLPRAIGWRLEADAACLVLEDLSDARWPPPYPHDVTPLFAALDEVAQSPVPAGLVEDPLDEYDRRRWEEVAADPDPLLGLRVCSERWLADALPLLIAAEERAVLVGDDLVHNDIWHGNLCFANGRVVLVDWAFACRGNRWFDVTAAIVSVRTAGIPPPPIAVPGGGELAALIAGHFAAEAPAPLAEWMRADATIREGQLEALRTALPYAAELLGLPPPSG